jgi:outer membrane lipoprotein-sorting protein
MGRAKPQLSTALAAVLMAATPAFAVCQLGPGVPPPVPDQIPPPAAPSGVPGPPAGAPPGVWFHRPDPIQQSLADAERVFRAIEKTLNEALRAGAAREEDLSRAIEAAVQKSLEELASQGGPERARKVREHLEQSQEFQRMLEALALIEQSQARGDAAARAQAQRSSQIALHLVRQSMHRSLAANVVAIITQPFEGERGVLRQKLEMNEAGMMRRTVLGPLRVQGREVVDDGRELRMYLPDAKRVVVQPSPRLLPCDLDFRMDLAGRNYRFQISGSQKIAGRDATCIVARPVSSDMETYRLYVDEKAQYLLRVEAVPAKGESRVLLDTLAIQFPKTVPDKVFEFRTIEQVRTERVPHQPTANGVKGAATRAETVRQQVGFDPIVPKRLPLGFAMQDTQISANAGVRFFAVRITDGLVRAKVYQYRRGAGSRPSFESEADKSYVDVGGVRLLLVSSMPEAARLRILESFAAEAAKGKILEHAADDVPAVVVLSAGPEPIHPAKAFVKGRGPETENRIQGATQTVAPVPVYGPD